jgi:hypothetical protein
LAHLLNAPILPLLIFMSLRAAALVFLAAKQSPLWEGIASGKKKTALAMT